MGVTYSIGQTLSTPGGTIRGSSSETAGGEAAIVEQSLSAEAGNVFMFLQFPVAAVKAMGFYCDQDCTIRTNNNGDPDNVIELVGGVPLLWNDSMPFANPLTTNVESIFVDNDSASTAKLTIRVLFDVLD